MATDPARIGLLQLLTVASGMMLAGCVSDGLDGTTVDVLDDQQQVISFEEYRDRARRDVNGKTEYVVEFDLYFTSEEALREYYDERVAFERGKSTAIIDADTGERLQFSSSAALNIRYCVSNSFGAKQAQVISDMEDVAPRTESAYANPATIPPELQPAWGSPCAAGTVCMDYANWRWTWLAPYPNITSAAVLRHEFGHILGLRHEHIRGGWENPTYCSGGHCIGAEYLTDSDIESIMWYPQNGGIADTYWNISRLDGVGIRELYGMPAAWYVPTVVGIQ
jgi:hypothetical protein